MEARENIDQNTQHNVAAALWLDKFDAKKLPPEVSSALENPKNYSAAFGARTKHYLNWLLEHPLSHNPSYKKRYKALLENCSELNAHQAYVVSSKFFGADGSQGYEPMPTEASLEFPRDHAAQLRSKVGWHFFVGSCWDTEGNEYGVEVMFFRVALLPPNIASELGLSDIENQGVELQFGISPAGGRHYQAEPVIVAGTSGLLEFQTDPFVYRLGKNEAKSLKKGQLFPLTLKAWGKDRGQPEGTELSVDLEFTSGKEYLYQGDNGCMPCVDGMGTLYYSVPELVLKAGSKLSVGGKTITLKKGTFWFDHQWGFLNGCPHSAVLRAANNMAKVGPAGWDWYMAQFVGNRQLTMFAPHSAKYLQYYYQTGPTPPANMTVDVAGKYFDEQGKLHNTWGTLTVDAWVKATKSPNPELYPVTNTWHPNHWKFSFDSVMPADIREFSMSQIVEGGQMNFFANSSQYNEGAVYLQDPTGKDIGRGFAEAVAYADTSQNNLALAGFPPDPKLAKVLGGWSPSLARRLGNLGYVLTHSKALKKVLSAGKGLEFFAKPTKHGSRHE